MSAQRSDGPTPWFPPPSTFRWGWSIPAEILEPLLRPAAPDGDPVRSADGLDAELPAG
jgi:hypothetical protein